MDLPEFRKQAQAALIAATNDATFFGTGFVRIMSDGTVERLDPKGIWLDPPSDDPKDNPLTCKCESGMTGPCKWDQCKHPLNNAAAEAT